MIDLPPDTLKGYWCPACGRFEMVRQAWHVRSGSIADRCNQGEMTAVLYGRIVPMMEASR